MDDDEYIYAPTIEKPLPCVFIQIWLLDTWGGNPAWVSIKDGQATNNGHYSIDCELDLPCAIKIYIWANIPDVVVVRPSFDLAYYYETDEINILADNKNQMDVDILLDPNQENDLKWSNIVATIYDEFAWIKDNTGTVVQGGVQRDDYIDVIYPYDSEQTSFYNSALDKIYLRSNDWLNDNTIQHEYGHAIMNAVGSSIFPTSALQMHDVFSEISETFAFSEGWAEFISCCVDNNATNLVYYLDPTGDVRYYNTIEENHWEKYEESETLMNDPLFDGEYVEGSVASILWDIFDDSTAIDVDEFHVEGNIFYSDGIDVINDDDMYITPEIIEPTFDDGLQMGIDEIFDVIINSKPDTILNFWDGWFSDVGNTAGIRNSPDNIHWMKAIYYNHGVKVNSKGNPETAPAPNLYMDILSSPSGGYSGTISLYASYVTDLDAEDIDFLRCRFEYYADSNGNGIADDGNNKWELVPNSESTNSNYDRTASWDTRSVLDGCYLLRAVVDDDMLETFRNYSDNPITVDNSKPISSVTPLGAYWRKDPSITITATASNGLSGVNNVKLYYRFSSNNATWTSWSQFGSADATVPYEWSFGDPNIGWPSGQGYYQFYSIATDNAGNVEAAPTTADAGYDTTFQHATKHSHKLFMIRSSYIPGEGNEERQLHRR
jgi:hypothetical protein